MTARSKRRKRSRFDTSLRIVTNLWIGLVIFVITLDTLPFGKRGPIQFKTIAKIQRTLKNRFLRRIGLFQGVWDLFAPDPVSCSDRISAQLTYENGETRVWRSINYTEATFWEWKQYPRITNWEQGLISLPEFLEEKSEENLRKFYLPLIRYLVKTETIEQRDGDGDTVVLLHPVSVLLQRHEKDVLPPPSPEELKEETLSRDSPKPDLSWLLGDPLVKRWSAEKTVDLYFWKQEDD